MTTSSTNDLLTWTGRDIPEPARSAETETYWSAWERGELWIRRCKACGKAHHYPRSLCPFCFGDTEWERASGHGIVYSYSSMLRAPVPYVIAYVTLAEGPTMLTNLVGCDPDAIRVGAPVRLARGPAEGGPPIPMFELA